MSKEKHPGGRPPKYTPDLGSYICEQIALGYSLRTVARDESVPDVSTILRWLSAMNEDGSYKYPEFHEQYARACEERTEAMAEDLLDIADDGTNDYMETDNGKQIYNGDSIQRAKLRVDTRKWLMSKMKPKKYGEKLDMTSGGEPIKTNTIVFTDFNDDTKGE